MMGGCCRDAMMLVVVAVLLTIVHGQNAEAAQLQRLRKTPLLVQLPDSTPDENTVDLNHIVDQDQFLWNRLLLDESSLSFSMSLSFSFQFDTCVAPGIDEFEIEADVNVGDTLFHPGPGFTRRCGPDCYTVKDSGDDPDYDPELGDTARFAYRTVESNQFSIKSRVCGVDCQRRPFCGRVGLMVRESLDPWARNLFVAHEPENQAIWWYREENGDIGDEPVFGMDGSPDVTCLWITIERDGSEFTFKYDYEGDAECELCGGCLDDLTQTLTLNMPEEVLVGLAVSSPAIEDYRLYTTANFRDIEFVY